MKAAYGLLLLLLLTACARPQQTVWEELPSSEALLQHLSATTGQVQSLDAAATVNLTVKDKRFSSQQFLLLDKPENIRTDVLAAFGKLILQLTVDGEELAVFVHSANPGHFFRGPATRENLARFTRIPLAAKDIVRLLLYDPPLIAYQQQEVLLVDEKLLLRLTGPDTQQELDFDQQLQLLGSRYFSAGRQLLEVKYQLFEPQDLFPRTIRIDLPGEETSAVIKFSELTLNAEIPTERFRLTPPENFPVEALP